MTRKDQPTSDIDVFRSTLHTSSVVQRNQSGKPAVPYTADGGKMKGIRKNVSTSLSFKQRNNSVNNESLGTEPQISGAKTNNSTSIGFNQLNRGPTTTLKVVDGMNKPNKIISYTNSMRTELRQQTLIAEKSVSINDDFNYKLVHNNNP